MQEKLPHKKPIGDMGPVRVTNLDGDPVLMWNKISWPAGKREQEMLVARCFHDALNKNENADWRLEQLEENSFDFVLRGDRGDRYLELQEIVIPPKKRGPPYADREQVVTSLKYADTILSEVGKKASKYSRSLAMPLDLLLYHTHWRFATSAMVRKLLAYRFRHNAHPFACVYMVSLFDGSSGKYETIFPNDEALEGFDPSAAAGHRYINFDPALAQSTKNGSTIGIRFSSQPRRSGSFAEDRPGLITRCQRHRIDRRPRALTQWGIGVRVDFALGGEAMVAAAPSRNSRRSTLLERTGSPLSRESFFRGR